MNSNMKCLFLKLVILFIQKRFLTKKTKLNKNDQILKSKSLDKGTIKITDNKLTRLNKSKQSQNHPDVEALWQELKFVEKFESLQVVEKRNRKF